MEDLVLTIPVQDAALVETLAANSTVSPRRREYTYIKVKR
jgi:hypothetical protein